MLLGKYVNGYYKKYWYLFLLGILFLGAIDYLQLLIPDLLGQLTDLISDGYLYDDVIRDVLIISLKVLAVGAANAIGRVLYRVCIFTTARKIEADLRQKMFEKATRLSRDFYHENKVGTILAWFTNDTQTVEEYFSWGTVMLIDAIFLGSVVAVKMFILDWILALFTLIPIILIVIWGLCTEKFMGKIWFTRQAADDKVYDFSTENFTGIRVIKAFVKERKEIRAFAKVCKENQDVNIKFARVNVVLDVVIEAIIALAIAVIMAVGGYCVYLTKNAQPLVIFGNSFEMNFKVSKLVTFIGYFDSIVWPMIALGQIIAMKARSKTSLERITNYLDTPEDIKSPENAVVLENVKGKIEFKNLTFRFKDSETDALKNVSFVINPGEKVGIVGKIGCGKTTIANILSRTFNVNGGSVFIDDVDIMNADLISLHDAIAYTPQDNFLFSDTVEANIAFSKGAVIDEEVKHAADFAGINKDIESFPKGFKTVSGERGVTLSGGQKQRIAIARAFLKDSPILILDDSVSAVDVSTEEEILHNIDAERKNKTTIVIASRVSTVSKFDKIIVLNDGCLEAFDTPKNLLETSETYKRMVLSQELQREVEGGK